MKKVYFFLLSALLMLTASLKAQTIVLAEGFENGIPATWTQVNVDGKQMWTVTSDNTYPKGTYSGDKCACLRNGTEQTIGYKTRLVTPEMNLVGVYQPVLMFAHAQAKWTADFDTLRVYYKTDAKADWKILVEYDKPVSDWTLEQINLPGVTGTYQLAFEGTDNLGRGIVIDSIQVRSMPECTVPHDMYVTNMSGGNATLGWQASLDADYFQIVLTTVAIDIDTLDQVASENIVLNFNMDADSTTYRVNNLVAGQYYWMYVRSLCYAENSEWGSYSFRMNAIEQIPYVENFNGFAYSAGKATRMPSWTYGGTADLPFINTGIASTASYAVGGYSLSFAANDDVTSSLRAGYNSYAVTPELIGAELKDCQVRFLASVADASGLRTNACAIIVGAMSDPENLATMQVIDTCYVWGAYMFEEKVIDLSKYTGQGHYICFLSDFTMPNRIFIDNIQVNPIKAKNAVANVKLCPKDNEVIISWDAAVGATAYNVAVTTTAGTTPSDMVAHQENVKATTCTLTGLETGHCLNRPYYAYVQAVYADGTSDWSYRIPFTTTLTGSIPMTFQLDVIESKVYQLGNNFSLPNEVSLYSNHNSSATPYPYLNTDVKHGSGNASLYQQKYYGEDTWVVMPRLKNADLVGSQITFYLHGGAQHYMDTRIGVGVMTNPADLSTFVQVAECRCSANQFSRHQINFADYKGQGEFIALVWLDTDNKGSNYAYIDDITVAKIGNCIVPAGIVAEPTLDGAQISWSAAGKTKWQVLVTNKYISDDIIETLDPTKPSDNVDAFATVETKAEYTYVGAQPATTHYVYVRSECDGGWSNWSSAQPFTTNCLPVRTTPFTETFDDYNLNTTNFPFCWMSNYDFSYSGGTTRYPSLSTAQTHSGTASLQMNTQLSARPQVYSHIVAPKLDLEVNKIRIKFFAYCVNTANVIYVGVMTNPADITTFQIVDSVKPVATATWEEHQVDLSNYTGTGTYIAFSNYPYGNPSMTQNTFYLDDITFASSACARPVGIHASTINDQSMTLEWSGTTTDQWEVVVSSTQARIDPETNELLGASVVFTTKTAANSVFVDNLKVATHYFIYVRPTCGLMEWGQGTEQTECTAIDPRKKNVQNFDALGASTTSYATAKKFSDFCWTSGSMNPSAATSYVPFIYKSTSANYAPSQPNCARLYTSTAATSKGPAWACSPEIDIDDMSKLLVSFSGYLSTSNAFLFGVMSDPNDPSTFVVLDSIVGSGKAVIYAFEMKDYADKIGNAKHIALRTPYDKACTFYFDDFSAVISTCSNPSPSVSNITSSTARVSGGLRESNSWRLIISKSALKTDMLTDPTYEIPASANVKLDTIISSSRPSITVKGLDERTTYYATVASVCDVEKMETSMYFSVNFTTPCAPIKLEEYPVISFEAAEGYSAGAAASNIQCWQNGNKNSTSASYKGTIKTDVNYPHSGEYYLSIATTAAADGGYAIMPAVEVDSIKRVQLHFFGYSPESTTGARSIIIGVITDPADMGTFVGIDTIVVTGPAVYRPYTVDFGEYEGDFNGDQGKYICFLSEFGGSNSFYIDDVSLDYAPDCPTPRSVKTISATETEAVVTWKGVAPSYQVVVAEQEAKGGDQPVAFKQLTAKERQITITGLTGGKQYYVYVASECGQSVVSDFCEAPGIINTTCPERYELPYACNFDQNSAYGESVMVDCWDGVYTGTNAALYPYIDATHGNAEGTVVLYSALSTNTKSIIALPNLNTEDLSAYALSFHAAKAISSSGSSIVIGCVSASYADMNKEFIPLDTVKVMDTSFRRIYVPLTQWKNELSGKRLAIKVDANVDKANVSHIYLDNVKVAKTASCIAPNLSNIQVGSDFIKATIEPVEGQNKWQVAILPFANIIAEADIDKVAKTVTSTAVTFDNLTAGTRYAFFVRALCSETEKSDWDDMNYNRYTLSTYDKGWFFGFEKSEAWQRSPLAETDAFYINPNLVSGTNTGDNYERYAYAHEDDFYHYAATGKGALCLSTTMGQTGAYVIFPAVESKDACAFSFDVRPGYANSKNTKMAYAGDNIAFRIGTVAQGKGIETFQELGNITLPSYTLTTDVNKENNFLFEHYVVNFPANDLSGRQLVLLNKSSVNTNIHFDNAKLADAEQFSTPLMKSFITADTYVDIEFVSNDVMTAYIVPGRTNTFDPSNPKVLKYENISKTAHLTGLEAETAYTIFLSVNNVPDGVATVTTVNRFFTTNCPARELDPQTKTYVFNFDDPEDLVQVAYSASKNILVPQCWVMGTESTSANSAPISVAKPGLMDYNFAPADAKGGTGKVSGGRNGSSALYWAGTKPVDVGPYATMPLVNCDFNETQLTFYLRPFTVSSATNKMDLMSCSGVSSQFPTQVIIGACTDPNDIETFTELTTVTYPYVAKQVTNVTMDTDPLGLDYWAKFTVPLATAKGKYITIKTAQPVIIFVDDITFEPLTQLFPPREVTTTNMTTNSVTVNLISAWHPTLKSIIRLYKDDKVTVLRQDTIDAGVNSYVINGLEPNTQYFVTAAQFNKDGASEETDKVEAYTECVAVDADYVCDFENGSSKSRMVSGATDVKYQQAVCWTYGNAGGNQAQWTESWPYNYYPFTGQSSRSGQNSVKLYTTRENMVTGYIVSPRLDETKMNLDNMQVEFWAIPDPREIGTDLIQYGYNIADNYAKSVVVGTCSDPADLSTFQPIRTCTYSMHYQKGDKCFAPDYLFEHFAVPLKGAVGPYVYIMATIIDADNQSHLYSTMYIDDVSFSPYTECETPSSIEQTARTTTSVDMEWTSPVTTNIIEVAKNARFENSDIVYCDTLKAPAEGIVYTAHVDGLKPHTTYYARVRAVCDAASKSTWSSVTALTTTVIPFWMEDFRSAAMRDTWTYGNTRAENLFNDQTGNVRVKGDNNSSYGWKRETKGYGVPGPHMACVYYTTASTNEYGNYWFITPTVQIPATAEHVHLTWDMALTQVLSASMINGDPVNSSLLQDSYVFAVIISEDGGNTWKRENATIWSNGTNYGVAEHTFSSIPSQAQTYEIDLTKYSGKDIKVAFYRESRSYVLDNCAIHIGNVRINEFVDNTMVLERCPFEDAEAYGMRIDGETAQGTVVAQRFVLADEVDMMTGPVADTSYTLIAKYWPMAQQNISATICEGRVYSEYGFTPVIREGIYRRKVVSPATGCDSITVLYLTTTKTLTSSEEQTICPGESFTWHNKQYNRSGLYRDTMTAVSTGCDSIATLVLTVLNANDTLREEHTITTDELPFNYYSISYPVGTKPGVYVDTIMVEGTTCKSAMIHKLIINQGTGLEQLIRSGELYHGTYKFIIRDRVFIVRDGKWYDVIGHDVDCPL